MKVCRCSRAWRRSADRLEAARDLSEKFTASKTRRVSSLASRSALGNAPQRHASAVYRAVCPSPWGIFAGARRSWRASIASARCAPLRGPQYPSPSLLARRAQGSAPAESAVDDAGAATPGAAALPAASPAAGGEQPPRWSSPAAPRVGAARRPPSAARRCLDGRRPTAVCSGGSARKRRPTMPTRTMAVKAPMAAASRRRVAGEAGCPVPAARRSPRRRHRRRQLCAVRRNPEVSPAIPAWLPVEGRRASATRTVLCPETGSNEARAPAAAATPPGLRGRLREGRWPARRRSGSAGRDRAPVRARRRRRWPAAAPGPASTARQWARSRCGR